MTYELYKLRLEGGKGDAEGTKAEDSVEEDSLSEENDPWQWWNDLRRVTEHETRIQLGMSLVHCKKREEPFSFLALLWVFAFVCFVLSRYSFGLFVVAFNFLSPQCWRFRQTCPTMMLLIDGCLSL